MGLFSRRRDASPVPIEDQGDGTFASQGLLLNRGAPLEVVGESYYQDVLLRICSGSRANRLPIKAVLMPEDNPHDDQAIGVYVSVDGPFQQIGHLSRQAARAFRPVLAEVARQGYFAVCEGYVQGRPGLYGVFLDVAPPGEAIPAD